MAAWKRNGSILLFTLLAAGTTFLYQNCARMEAGPRILSSDGFDLGAGDKTASTGACTFNGLSLENGETTIAFQASSVPLGTACTSEPRVCHDGHLSGSYNYASCNVDGPRSCLFNGRTIDSGETVTAYLNSSVAFGASCEPQTRTCNDGVLSGNYAYATCAVGAPKACLFNGQTIRSGQSLTAYSSSSVPFGQSCESETRTCTDGTLSGSHAFASCNVDQPASCLFDGRTVANGETVLAYARATMPYGQSCTAESRVCTNGVLSGSFTAPSCEVEEWVADDEMPTAPNEPAPPPANEAPTESPTPSPIGTCSFNGIKLANGESIKAYQAAKVPYGQSCVSETRTCTDGILSGTFTASSCFVIQKGACLFNGLILQSGASIRAYDSATVPTGESCLSHSEVRYCKDGVLSGSFPSRTCQVLAP